MELASGVESRFRAPTDVLRAIGVALVPLAILLPFLQSPGFELLDGDTYTHFDPRFQEYYQRLLTGEFPLWSDTTRCGLPLYAVGAFGPMYPPHLPAYVVGKILGVPGYQVAYLGHLSLAAFFAFLYLRYVGVRPVVAFAGAVAFSLSGTYLGYFRNWPTYGFVTAYIPAALLVIERIRHESCPWFWLVLGGLILSCVDLVGGLLLMFKFHLMCGLYALLRWDSSVSLRMFLRLGAIMVFGGLLSAGPVWAQVQYVRQTRLVMQTEGRLYGNEFATSFDPSFLIAVAFPFLQLPWAYPWGSRFTGLAVFAGPLMLLGGMLAAAHWRRSGPHRALCLMVLLYAVFVLGHHCPTNVLLQDLPVWRMARWPIRWTLEFCALGALLGAVGLEVGLRTLQEARTRWCFGAFAAGVAFVLVAFQPYSDLYAGYAGLFATIWICGVVGLSCGAFFDRPGALASLAAAFTLIACASVIPLGRYLVFNPRAALFEQPLRLPDTRGRILFLAHNRDHLSMSGEGSYSMELPRYHGGRSVLGYCYFPFTQGRCFPGFSHLGLIEGPEAESLDAVLQGHLLDTLRVAYILIPKDNDAIREACAADSRLTLEGEDRSVLIYRNRGFQEPAFFVRETIAPSAIAWDRLGAVDLAHGAVVEDDPAGPSRFSSEGIVRRFEEKHGDISFGTQSDDDGFVVVTTTHDSGWIARIDGREVPIRRTNGFLMGLHVPRGDHEITLSYCPIGTIAGALATVALWLTACSFCSIEILRRLRAKEGRP